MPAKDATYPEADIPAKLLECGLKEWYFEDGWIRRKFFSDGWPQTLMAINAIAFVCEANWHHADLAITWGKFWVKLQTHDAGGITDKDFELAKKIEELLLARPGEGSALAPGNPKKFVFTKN